VKYHPLALRGGKKYRRKAEALRLSFLNNGYSQRITQIGSNSGLQKQERNSRGELYYKKKNKAKYLKRNIREFEHNGRRIKVNGNMEVFLKRFENPENQRHKHKCLYWLK
jgi:hypothetical protein|tara:strand:+ start:919 stop:1248 length:330 start_codon:yes stop_codon:yes gene_type:complete